MILLLSIYKKNREYYVDMVDTEHKKETVHSQLVNSHILKECQNINVCNYKNPRQYPLEYMKGNFDTSKLLVTEKNKKDKERDFQILTVYYKNENEPCLYQAIDRTGKISLHDISELEYTKNSIFGNDIRALPLFVQHKSIESAYEELKKLEKEKLHELPCNLFKQYLLYIKGFQEGYYTITEINNGVDLTIHEQMLFNGSATIKLIECIPKKKTMYLTKQDALVSPYPKERTVGFMTNDILLIGSSVLIASNISKENEIKFGSFNKNGVIITLPLSFQSLDLIEKINRAKRMYVGWHLNAKGNFPKELYNHILPNELFKIPNRFYHEMKSKPFNTRLYLAKENDCIDLWIHTVALYFSWQYFTPSFKQKMKPILRELHQMIQQTLKDLVCKLGPTDALYVMKWTKEHMKKALEALASSNELENEEIVKIDDEEALFSFYQNDYKLPESLKVYSTETIDRYGGEQKVKEDYINATPYKQQYIINTLETIEKRQKTQSTDDKIKSYHN